MGLRLFQLSIKGSSLPRSDRDCNDPIASKSWSQIEFRDMKPNALSKQEFKMIKNSSNFFTFRKIENFLKIQNEHMRTWLIRSEPIYKNKNNLTYKC